MWLEFRVAMGSRELGGWDILAARRRSRRATRVGYDVGLGGAGESVETDKCLRIKESVTSSMHGIQKRSVSDEHA